MAREWIPWESVKTVWWVPMNDEVKKAFAWAVKSLLWQNKKEKEDKSQCSKCNQPYDPDCQICNGNVFTS